MRAASTSAGWRCSPPRAKLVCACRYPSAVSHIQYRPHVARVPSTHKFQMRVLITARHEGEWHYSNCPILDVTAKGARMTKRSAI